MRPSTVVRRALGKGLDVIAICDHNSAENVEAVTRAADSAGLAVIGGMEITSREEVHVLGLFDDRDCLREAQNLVYDSLPGENDPDTFGEQYVMDEHDEVIRHNRRLLIGAATLTLDEVVQTIHGLGGIAIASHVDRPSFSVLSQLGFIPEGLGLDGVEVCSASAPAIPPGMAAIRSSDAHRPEEIGARSTRFLLERPTTEEIGLALHRRKGRKALEQ
jgi:predicted metal-dependent phosphoesterase TrpH